MTQRVRILVPVVLLLVGAALLWVASRATWLEVVAFNDQSGSVARTLTGSDWQPALVPLALGAVAAVAAVALVRGTGARVVGAVIALLGVAAATLLFSGVGEVDEYRVHSVVTSTEGQARTDAGPGAEGSAAVPEWSQITEISTSSSGLAPTGAGAVALLAAGLVVMIRPAHAVRRDDRYVTPAARRAEATGSVDGERESDRDLWQELDDGRDPTE